VSDEATELGLELELVLPLIPVVPVLPVEPVLPVDPVLPVEPELPLVLLEGVVLLLLEEPRLPLAARDPLVEPERSLLVDDELGDDDDVSELCVLLVLGLLLLVLLVLGELLANEPWSDEREDDVSLEVELELGLVLLLRPLVLERSEDASELLLLVPEDEVVSAADELLGFSLFLFSLSEGSRDDDAALLELGVEELLAYVAPLPGAVLAELKPEEVEDPVELAAVVSLEVSELVVLELGVDEEDDNEGLLELEPAPNELPVLLPLVPADPLCPEELPVLP